MPDVAKVTRFRHSFRIGKLLTLTNPLKAKLKYVLMLNIARHQHTAIQNDKVEVKCFRLLIKCCYCAKVRCVVAVVGAINNQPPLNTNMFWKIFINYVNIIYGGNGISETRQVINGIYD